MKVRGVPTRRAQPVKRTMPAWLRAAPMALALGLSTCAPYQPFTPTPIADIPPGPGLFSGDDGEFKVH